MCAKRKQMKWNWTANQPKTDESQITVLQHHSFHALGLFSISAAVIIHLPCLSSEKRVLYTQLLCFHKPSVWHEDHVRRERRHLEADERQLVWGLMPLQAEGACICLFSLHSGETPTTYLVSVSAKPALSVCGLRHRSGVSRVQRWTCRKMHYLS